MTEKLRFPTKDEWAYQVRKWSNVSQEKCTPEQTLITNIVAQAMYDCHTLSKDGIDKLKLHHGGMYKGMIPGYCKVLGIDVDYLTDRVAEACEKVAEGA